LDINITSTNFSIGLPALHVGLYEQVCSLVDSCWLYFLLQV